ncbi:MAG: hypothetical protein JXA69_13415 [Phycisphaerae bacterium]|nr:hypothetical protein [Phycisphaerae bacterium]
MGIEVSLDEVQRMAAPEKDGSCSMLNLKACAEALGLFAYGLEMSPEDLAAFDGVGIANTYTRSPSGHYVVVAGVREGEVLVVDPFGGSCSRVAWVPMSMMAKMWNGRMLVLSRTELDVKPGLRGSSVLNREPTTTASAPEDGAAAARPTTQAYGGIEVAENPIIVQNNEPGKPLRSTFVLSNTTDFPMHIESINPCCGVSAVMTPRTENIGPWESVTIEVSGILPEQTGTEARTILVEAIGANEDVTIPLTWMIKPPTTWCDVRPSRVGFGAVVHGEAVTRTIVVYPRKGVGAGTMTSDSPALVAQMNQEGLTARNGAEFTITLDTSLIENAGWWRGTLQMSSNDAELRNVTIETTAYIKDPVVVVPRQIGLGRVPCGQSVRRVVKVRVNATGTTVLAVDSSDENLIPRLLSEGSGGNATLEVEWTPDAAGQYKAAVVIETDNPFQPSTNVFCYGIAVSEERED